MAWELVKVAYVISLGFVGAGIVASFYQLMTHRPPSFIVSLETWGTVFGSIALCAFAGPFIVMRNAIRGRRIENRPIGWLMLGTLITAAWSFCFGLVMIDFTHAIVP